MSYTGSGLDWRKRNYLLSTESASVDPLFSDVVILANGEDLLVDNSQYGWTVSSGGIISLDNTYPLNGAPTYNVRPGGGLYVTQIPGVITLMGADSFCVEFWIRVVNYSANQRTVSYSPCIFYDTGLPDGNARCGFNIGGVFFVIPSVYASMLVNGLFNHVALIRDNVTVAGAGNGVCRLFINGSEVGSVGGIPKGDVATQSTLQIMGFDNLSPHVAIGGYRATRRTRRYMTNVEGAPPTNNFTPDPYPFALGPIPPSTWSTVDKDADVTLSNADSTASVSASLGAVRGVRGRNAAGDFYFEVTIGGVDANQLVGIGLVSASITTYPGFDANGRGYYLSNGNKFVSDAGAAYGAVGVVGDVIGVRLNAGSLTFYKNGVSQGVAFSGLVGTWYPMWGPGTGAAGVRSATLNTNPTSPFPAWG